MKLPAALLSLVALLLSTSLVQASQIPLQALEDDTPVHAQRTTIVDLLSLDGNYTHLVYLLQRSRLVPTINRLHNGSTLFAPLNSAIEAAALQESDDPIWSLGLQQDTLIWTDNINAKLRATLLYHLLNVTLPLNSNITEPILLPTMLFPHPTKAGNEKPGGPFPDSPDVHSLLGNASQVIRFLASPLDDGNHTFSVGVDAYGQGGVSVVYDKIATATNGIILPIETVLPRPKSIGHLLRAHEKLTTVRELYSEEALHSMVNQSEITLFAPADDAWKQLDEMEMSYLRSGFAQSDLKEIFDHHTTRQEHVGYVDQLLAQGTARTLSNHSLEITKDGDNIKVNESTVVERDILASNGVLHIMDSLLLPAGSLQLNAEKTLLALNCTRFVTLLRDAGLSNYVQNADQAYTILAPKDDVFAEWYDWANLPSPGSSEMKTLLRYHFVEGKYEPSDLEDQALLRTALRPNKLKGESQRLQVFKSSSESGELISFGNANVEGNPITVGSSIIYLVSQPVEPPGDLLSTALTDLHLSTFVASVYAADLDKKLKRAFSTTLVAPTNTAFERLGLVLSYLLLPSSIEDLRSVIRYHFLDGVAYLRDLQQDSTRFRTLEGSDIDIVRQDNRTTLEGPKINGYPVSGQITPTNLTSGDLLTSTGVAHVIDQVMLPISVQITNRKLLQGAKAETMAHLIRRANMTWILDGKDMPTELTKSKAHSATERSYTLLAPSDHAFSRVNLTYYENNPKALQDLIRLHIISQDAEEKIRGQLNDMMGRPFSLKDGLQMDTLLSKKEGGKSQYGTIAFRLLGDSFLCGIKGARGTLENDWAHVVSFGRATPRLDMVDVMKQKKNLLINGGGVLTIDTVLLPYQPDWFHRWGWIVVVVALALVGVVCLGLLGWRVYENRRDQVYEPLEGEES